MTSEFYTFTDTDLQGLIREQQHKRLRFEAQVQACELIIRRLRMMIARRAVDKRSLQRGDVVTVQFKGGSHTCRYEGLEQCKWTGCPQVRLRHFTTKGKPYKHAATYGSTIIPFITRKD